MRYRELTRGVLPGFNPEWGHNRLIKELYRNNFRYIGPARGSGKIYRNEKTGVEIRVMERLPHRNRSDPDAKHIWKYYYRYRTGKDQKWKSPVPILEKL